MKIAKKKRVSKKNKSSWRKHVDITDVDNFLESSRLEERIGTFEDVEDKKLFKVDKAPTKKSQKVSVKARRKIIAERPLKCFQSLENTSKVVDPLKDRPKVKNLKNMVTMKQSSRKTKPDGTSSKEGEKEEIHFDHDLWCDDKPSVDVEKKVSALDNKWFSKKLIDHTLRNTGTAKFRVPKTARKETSKLKAFEAPHPGMSYNPTRKDHKELLESVVDTEKELMKKKEHLDRVTKRMFTMISPQERDAQLLQEMSTGLGFEVEIKEEDEIKKEFPDDESYLAINPPVERKPKSRKALRNKVEEIERRNLRDLAKVEKKKISDIVQIGKLKQSIVKKEMKVANRRNKEDKEEAEKDYKPRRLGPLAFKEVDMDVAYPEEVTRNLRTTQNHGNILKDRYVSLEKRNMVAPSKRQGVRKRHKVKSYIKNTHKGDLVKPIIKQPKNDFGAKKKKLLQLVYDNRQELFTLSRMAQKRKWEEFAAELNALPGVQRSREEWRLKFTNIKTTFRLKERNFQSSSNTQDFLSDEDILLKSIVEAIPNTENESNDDVPNEEETFSDAHEGNSINEVIPKAPQPVVLPFVPMTPAERARRYRERKRARLNYSNQDSSGFPEISNKRMRKSPMTSVERTRRHRERKRTQVNYSYQDSSNFEMRKAPMTPAERARRYRERKRALIAAQSNASSTVDVPSQVVNQIVNQHLHDKDDLEEYPVHKEEITNVHVNYSNQDSSGFPEILNEEKPIPPMITVERSRRRFRERKRARVNYFNQDNSNFEMRKSPMTPAERARRYRERKRARLNYSNQDSSGFPEISNKRIRKSPMTSVERTRRYRERKRALIAAQSNASSTVDVPSQVVNQHLHDKDNLEEYPVHKEEITNVHENYSNQDSLGFPEILNEEKPKSPMTPAERARRYRERKRAQKIAAIRNTSKVELPSSPRPFHMFYPEHSEHQPNQEVLAVVTVPTSHVTEQFPSCEIRTEDPSATGSRLDLRQALERSFEQNERMSNIIMDLVEKQETTNKFLLQIANDFKTMVSNLQK